jgi:hypothetical protein
LVTEQGDEPEHTQNGSAKNQKQGLPRRSVLLSRPWRLAGLGCRQVAITEAADDRFVLDFFRAERTLFQGFGRFYINKLYIIRTVLATAGPNDPTQLPMAQPRQDAESNAATENWCRLSARCFRYK